MILEAFDKFWLRHPALLYASTLAFAAAIALGGGILYYIPLAALFWPIFFFRRYKALGIRISLAAMLGFAFGVYINASYYIPIEMQDAVQAVGTFEITSLSRDKNYYGKQWIYQGTLKSCYSKDEGILLAKNIPCVIRFPSTSKSRPTANQSYYIKGIFKNSSFNKGSTFSLKDIKSWVPIPYSYSLAELRYQVKDRVKNYISSKISDVRSATFLVGLATGDFSDKLMLFEFSRFGLQHIMAISGFHFAIVSGVLSVLLRLILPRKKAVLFLIFTLSSYYVFLGPTPSVMRAWLMILVALTAFLLEKKSFSINALGFSVLCMVLFDPLVVFRLGFIFSVLVTASILMNYKIAETMMQKVLKIRTLPEVSHMNLINQHGYLAIAFVRCALSLAIAVNLVALPLTLYFFNKFPLLGFLFNLFFPFLVSVSILLLIMGTITVWIPPVSWFIHFINTQYTSLILNFAYNTPLSLDFYLRMDIISLSFLVVYLTCLFSLSIAYQSSLEKPSEKVSNFAFV